MPPELSDYEKQRLANIARNLQVLESLGLGEKLAVKKKPAAVVRRKSDDDDDEGRAPVALRHSNRQSQAPVAFMSLSHDQCLDEEKALRRKERESTRPSRKRNVTATYAEQQADEMLAKEETNAKRRQERNREKLLCEANVQRVRMASVAAAAPVLPSMQQILMVGVPAGSLTHKPGCVGPVARCRRCGNFWAVRRSDGQIRDHTCIPMAGARAEVAASQPMLPAM